MRPAKMTAKQASESVTVHGRTLYLDRYRDTRGKHRWRVKSATNGKNVANGSQGYTRSIDMKRELFDLAQAMQRLVWWERP